MRRCSAALLAGGRSSRMGRDKCLIEIDGKPLWQRQVEILTTLTSDVMVAAPSRPAWCPPGLKWIADVLPGTGPLGGLAAALTHATHPRVILLAVDLPEMSGRCLRPLLEMSTAACGTVPMIDGLSQPLSAVYPRSAAILAARHLQEPDKSLQRLIRRLVAAGAMQHMPVAEFERRHFRNLNTPTD